MSLQTPSRAAKILGVLATLTRTPVRLVAQWRSKTVTTDPPRYTPHLEWDLILTISADIPIRVAALLEGPADTRWGLSPDNPSTEMEVRAMFSPYAWARSDEVEVNFGFQWFAVTDPALKNDPRTVVDVVLPPMGTTAEAFAVARLQAHAITLTAVAVAEADTQRRRGDRWRIDPRHGDELPVRLAPLMSGHQTGVIKG